MFTLMFLVKQNCEIYLLLSFILFPNEKLEIVSCGFQFLEQISLSYFLMLFYRITNFDGGDLNLYIFSPSIGGVLNKLAVTRRCVRPKHAISVL